MFGTAGWAWGTPSTAYSVTGASASFTNGATAYGWTAGAGIDYAITNSVFGRVEYRHTSLAAPSFVDVASNSSDTANKAPINDFRVGLAYKFDGIPIVEKF